MPVIQMAAIAVFDNDAKEFLEACIHFDLFGIYYDFFPNIKKEKGEKQAYDELKKSEDIVNKLIDKKLVSSGLFRLKGEINLRMLAFVGMAGGGMIAVDLSNAARKYFNRAISLDPKNYRAILNLGTWYLFAPMIAGGDAKIAVKLFTEAGDKGGIYVKYMSMIWKIMAYYSYMQQPEQARIVLDDALAWLPDHGWFLDLKSAIAAGKPLTQRN